MTLVVEQPTETNGFGMPPMIERDQPVPVADTNWNGRFVKGSLTSIPSLSYAPDRKIAPRQPWVGEHLWDSGEVGHRLEPLDRHGHAARGGRHRLEIGAPVEERDATVFLEDALLGDPGRRKVGGLPVQGTVLKEQARAYTFAFRSNPYGRIEPPSAFAMRLRSLTSGASNAASLYVST
jgi:hypothetical protein